MKGQRWVGEELTDKAVKHLERLNYCLRTVTAADKEYTGLISNRQLPFLTNRSTLTTVMGNSIYISINMYKSYI